MLVQASEVADVTDSTYDEPELEDIEAKTGKKRKAFFDSDNPKKRSA